MRDICLLVDKNFRKYDITELNRKLNAAGYSLGVTFNIYAYDKQKNVEYWGSPDLDYDQLETYATELLEDIEKRHKEQEAENAPS